MMTSDDRERYEQIYRWGVEMGKVRMDLSANMSKLYAAEKRVAELEARLAELEARLAELGVEQDEYNPEDDPIWQQADAAYERVTGIFTPPPAATE